MDIEKIDDAFYRIKMYICINCSHENKLTCDTCKLNKDIEEVQNFINKQKEKK